MAPLIKISKQEDLDNNHSNGNTGRCLIRSLNYLNKPVYDLIL